MAGSWTRVWLRPQWGLSGRRPDGVRCAGGCGGRRFRGWLSHGGRGVVVGSGAGGSGRVFGGGEGGGVGGAGAGDGCAALFSGGGGASGRGPVGGVGGGVGAAGVAEPGGPVRGVGPGVWCTRCRHTMAALVPGVCSERVAVAVVQATATLSVADRGVVDARVGPLLGRLGVKQAGAAAARVAAELDAASVVRPGWRRRCKSRAGDGAAGPGRDGVPERAGSAQGGGRGVRGGAGPLPGGGVRAVRRGGAAGSGGGCGRRGHRAAVAVRAGEPVSSSRWRCTW